ncbi:MAG: glycosyltransferase family 4 protein [Deltaproteobacteria bacterium]|nr:glycosyltransferase family 4 protein [Deltaproteobacteria bacterium]
MKIVFLTSSLAAKYGGAAFSESSLVSELSRSNEVTALSRWNRVDLNFAKKQGLKTIRTFRPIEVLLASIWQKHWLADEIAKAEVFHLNGHWYWENYFFARLCKKHGTPYVLHPRGMLWVAYRRPRLKRLFNLLMGNWIVYHATKVILLSQFEKKHCEAYPIKEERLVIIPNGITISNTVKLSGKHQNYFLYIGRIEPRKNLEFLIRAFKKVSEVNLTCQLRLVGPVERNYDQGLRKLIIKLSLEDRVLLLPPAYDRQKEDLFRNATSVIYPAYEEAFGRTVFESFATGTLCLLPRASGGAELVNKFAPEVIYQTNCEASLSEKMLEVLGYECQKRTSCIEIAQDWISKNLNWQSISKQVLAIYSETLT